MACCAAQPMRTLRPVLWAIVLLVVLSPGIGRADPLGDLHALVENAAAQYRVAMTTLEASGREQTALEVRRFRSAWQAVMEQFAANRPAAFVADDEYPSVFMQIDAMIVGALIVIDIGSRDAARKGLMPIGAILTRLQDRSAPAQ
jgi:hypothetical protein